MTILSKFDGDVSERISVLRFVLIYGIIVLHVPPYIPLESTGSSIFDLTKAMMQHAVFRCSVPILTFISGFLLFSFSMDLNFRSLIAKKVKTILIPLLLFNIPLAFVVYLIQKLDIVDYEFSAQLYPFDMYRWINATTALFGESINYPLGFLRDLFVISILAPVFGIFLRNWTWLGLTVVFVTFWFNFDGQLVLRNVMPINFYMGGMAAILGWNLRKLDPYAPYLLLIFVSSCIAIVAFSIENRNYLRLVAPIMIWPAASILVGTVFSDFLTRVSKYSFAIFLMHGPILLVLWFLYEKFFQIVPYSIFWLSVPAIVSVLVIGIHTYCYRWFPKASIFALGGR